MVPPVRKTTVRGPSGIQRRPETARSGIVQVLDKARHAAASAFRIRAESFRTGEGAQRFCSL